MQDEKARDWIKLASSRTQFNSSFDSLLAVLRILKNEARRFDAACNDDWISDCTAWYGSTLIAVSYYNCFGSLLRGSGRRFRGNGSSSVITVVVGKERMIEQMYRTRRMRDSGGLFTRSAGDGNTDCVGIDLVTKVTRLVTQIAAVG